MIRVLAIVGLMFAGSGYASAEMAAPAKKPAKPAKEITRSGCTSLGIAGCFFFQAGKQQFVLTANPGVVLPPAGTYIVARGVIKDPEPGFCRAAIFHASKIIQTRRACKK